MQTTQARAIGRRLLAWYRRNRRDLPWRLERDPYRIWVSEVMLQQTTVAAVIPYYRRFLKSFPTVGALARAGEPRVLAAWSGLGYYRRARALHQAARLIVERHGGHFPRRPEEALALPGVGRYTAGAVLSIAYGLKEPVLDGNVTRVLSRLRLLRDDPRGGAAQKRLWGMARSLVEASRSPGDLNQALMELGAIVCTPASPSCLVCPLAPGCLARDAGEQETIPPPRRGRRPETQRLKVAVVRRAGRLLMRRRGRTGLMDGLWELPELDGDPALRPIGRIGKVRHAVTFRRMEIEVHDAALLSEPATPPYRWVTPAALGRLPIASLTRKTLRAAGFEV